MTMAFYTLFITICYNDKNIKNQLVMLFSAYFFAVFLKKSLSKGAKLC